MKKIIQYSFAVLILFLVPQLATSQEMVIIINSENPSAALSLAQVKYTYMRKLTKRWKELNKNIVPVDRNGTPTPEKNS